MNGGRLAQNVSTARMNAREAVLNLLLRAESGDRLPAFDAPHGAEERHRAFVGRLAKGTVERRIQLDYILNGYARIPVKKMKPLIRNLLRMSVYQLLFMEKTPDSAVVNEAVKLAERRGHRALKGFVNGVLRSVIRARDDGTLRLYPALDTEESGRSASGAARGFKDKDAALCFCLSVRYSMPEEICAMWLDAYGAAQTEDMLAALLRERPVTLRLKETLSEEARERLRAAIAAELQGRRDRPGHGSADEPCGILESPLLPYAVSLPWADGLRHLPGYAEGLWTVQDVGSMLAVEAAGIRPGDTVVDVCAAPGGKALHAAEKAGLKSAASHAAEQALSGAAHPEGGEAAHNESAAPRPGSVLARDRSEDKCARILENAARLRCGNIAVAVHDATVPDTALYESADVLLCDLPCSGLGVIGRKPDIKYRFSRAHVEALTALQRRILETCWRYVKPGGILMYSTCTICRAENEAMVQWFLEKFPFTAVDLTDALPAPLRAEETLRAGYLQLLPGRYDTDGFFLAKLRRNK